MILRLGAIAVAIAGLIDPALARRVPTPHAIAIHLPPSSDPDFTRAAQLRAEVAGAIGDVAIVDGPSAPRVIVAIGNAVIPDRIASAVFTMPLAPLKPSIAIVELAAPEWTVPGQAAPVRASLRGVGVVGRKTTVSVELRGSIVATVTHDWKKDDERFEASFALAPAVAGVERVRVIARTSELAEVVTADTVVTTRAQPLRVLAFEPRPSWPLAFVRRSLEGTTLFDLAVTSRTSRPAATTAGGAPLTLAALDPERFDAILVGAPEELSDADLRMLDRFVERRGGTLILLPDRQLPESIRRRFAVPATAEVLVETPVSVEGAAAMRASELLLLPAAGGEWATLASVRHGGSSRPVIAAVDRGAGRVVFAGALDAWRYRADASGGFDAQWRSLVTDAAIAARPRIHLTTRPAIARSGEEVVVIATVRGTAIEGGESRVMLPSIAAWVTSAEGRREMIRLWPGVRPGQYRGSADRRPGRPLRGVCLVQ